MPLPPNCTTVGVREPAAGPGRERRPVPRSSRANGTASRLALHQNPAAADEHLSTDLIRFWAAKEIDPSAASSGAPPRPSRIILHMASSICGCTHRGFWKFQQVLAFPGHSKLGD